MHNVYNARMMSRQTEQIFLVFYPWGQGCGIGVPRSPGFGPQSESLIWRWPRLQALSVSSGLLCNFVAVYLTFVQFILQLKLCLYTIVHLLLEEFTVQSFLTTQSLCHTISRGVGVEIQFFSVPELESYIF